MKQQKALTLKTLTKSNVWEVEENDIFRMWETAEKESDFRDNRNHYIDVIRSAFEIEEIKIDKPEVIKKYEARDFKVGNKAWYPARAAQARRPLPPANGRI